MKRFICLIFTILLLTGIGAVRQVKAETVPEPLRSVRNDPASEPDLPEEDPSAEPSAEASPEDAALQMELLGHSFYVFINAETEQIAVVYKRKGNTYGMIEPGN